uniref:Uncharacterized protein n=1 Tax=Anguilla anguilla TaxID=7936 RepID=A0A0E9XVG2_ANGAN
MLGTTYQSIFLQNCRTVYLRELMWF